MNNPNIGILVAISPQTIGGEVWIQDLFIQGAISVAGIDANAADCTLYLSHVIMFNYSTTQQPSYGIVVVQAGEVVICNGTDIGQCNTCLAIIPGNNSTTGQFVVAVVVSDSFFDSGYGTACVYIYPTSNGFVSTVRFSNVWASTDFSASTNGFMFVGTASMPPTGVQAIQDVSLVNCVGKNFVGHDGLYANGVNALAVTGSTFGGNYDGIHIGPNMSNFVLNGNKCGNYVIPSGSATGTNTNYGINIDYSSTAVTDHYIVANNLLVGNGNGALFNGGTGSNQVIANNLGN